MTKEVSGKGVRQQAEELLLKFCDDTPETVSWQTVNQLVEILGADSVEALVHLVLSEFAVRSGLRYPPDDGLPSAEQMDAISKMEPQDQELVELKSLFGQVSNNESTSNGDLTLEGLISGVTEENKHNRIDFGKRVGQEKL
jgi:hypothetical protein